MGYVSIYQFSSCLKMWDSPSEQTLVVNVKPYACHGWSSKAVVFGFHAWYVSLHQKSWKKSLYRRKICGQKKEIQNQCQQNSGTARVFQRPFGGRVSAAPSRARYPSKSLAESCPARDLFWQKFLGLKPWLLGVSNLDMDAVYQRIKYRKWVYVWDFSLRVSRVSRVMSS